MQQPPVINTTSGATEAQANPAATHTRESSFSCNVNYLTSPTGILKALEVLFGLLTWALFAASYQGNDGNHQFVMFVTVTAWLTTLITMFIYFCGLHASLCEGAPWLIIEFSHNVFWSLFYVIAACVAAATVHVSLRQPQFTAGAVFSFFVALTYIIHCFTSFRDWRGNYPCA